MKKKKILVISGAAILAMVSFAGTSMALKPSYNVAFAEEEPTSEVVAEQPTEETTNKFKEIWESYLLPAVLSINVASIVSAAITIVFAIKNFKNHRDYKEQVVKVVESVTELAKQMIAYSLEVSKRNEQVQNLLLALNESEKTVEKQMELIAEEKACFEELKKASLSLINLEVELAKANPEFVKNGLATQIVEIKNQLMKVAK